MRIQNGSNSTTLISTLDLGTYYRYLIFQTIFNNGNNKKYLDILLLNLQIVTIIYSF